jgi:7,8-dihydropterin-6-yl-methyl-4-(beta-D-ribofuranosyl)aminobenzene 5'-phosphate synthase
MVINHLDITLIVDNKADPNLAAEHGLAMWIDATGRHILFDTGQGPALAANAEKLGIALEQTDTIVLSHGHYDHTGGVHHVLQCNPAVELFCHPGAIQPRYSMRNGSTRAIHMPGETMAALERLPGQRMHWVSEPMKISEDIGLTGPIPRASGFEDAGGPFYLDPGARRTDAINDDMALWINTPKGLVVCVGCAHAGLINTLNHVRRLSGGADIHAVVGGFHLKGARPERIRRTVSQLKVLKPATMVACHCTGENAITALERAYGSRISRGYAGMRLHF